MLRRSLMVRRTALLGVAVAVLAAAPASAARTEQPLATPPGPFPDVTRSLVTIDAPMPEGVPAHPAACDQLRYYRYRHTGGYSGYADQIRHRAGGGRGHRFLPPQS